MIPNLRHCKPSVLFYRGSFPNHLDSGFHSIVDDLFRSGGYEAGFSFYRSGRGGVSGQ